MASQNRFFPPLPKGHSFGNYRIEYVLNQDELGVTYVAWDTERTAWAFIKESLPQASALREADGVQVKARDGMEDHYLRHLADFYEEADAMSKLDHPGVAKVLRFFRSGGTAYYVMPCDGEMSLGQWFDAKGMPENTQLRTWLRSMVEALGYLHSQELGPWDITPSSFMIKPDGTTVLVAFDVLRHLIGGNADLCRTSPEYAGIELVKGENVGPWTDFYALGVTLYKLLTGEPVPTCTRRRKDDMLIPLCNRPLLLKRYGEALLRSIDKAMAFSSADRWQSADEWLQVLDALPETVETVFPVMPEPPQNENLEEPPAPKPVEPAPEPAEPAPAPVVVPEPAAVAPVPEKVEPIQKPRRSSIGNMVAVACGVLLAMAGCTYFFFRSHHKEIAPVVEQEAPVVSEPATPEPVAPKPVEVATQTPVAPVPTTPEPEIVQTVSPPPATPTPVVQTPVTPVPDAPKPVEQKPTPATDARNLLAAAKSGDVDAAKRFLGQGCTSQENHEALGAAISRGDAAMVGLLLEHGGDMKMPFDKKMDALGLAISEGKTDVAILLIKRGSPRNTRYAGDDRALMLAAKSGNLAVMKALLEEATTGNVNKANVSAVNKDGDTPLLIALREGHVDCAKLLIKHNSDVNARNKAGKTPLMYAGSIRTLDDAQRNALIRSLKVNGAKK